MLDQFLDFSPNFGVDTALLLLVLVALEAVLSADNAIALAAIAQGMSDRALQRRALNVGLVVAFALRIALILTATWVIRFWQFELLGAVYLLWLVGRYFWSGGDGEGESGHHAFRFDNLWQAVPAIAITDLAFSLDSVTTAIALSHETWLVLAGGTLGIITLRFMAGLFVRWLEVYARLETAGYATVGLVGVRLSLRAISTALSVQLWVPPDWLMIAAIGALFAWGFSKRRSPAELAAVAAERPDEAAETAEASDLPGDRAPAGNAPSTES